MDKEQETSVEREAAVQKAVFPTELASQLEKEAVAENKIRLCIDFMRGALSQGDSPRFRDFWGARGLCLPLFKENLNPKLRAQLWGEYIELSAEARRVKQILDEQSAFAAEQIELAIGALETELKECDQRIATASIPPLPDAASLQPKKEFYSALQKELHVLNAMATRVNVLRKEVLKTEMRIRTKNKFFDRLSACGDLVFPKRKEKIQTISEAFSSDVALFVQASFEEGKGGRQPPYLLREEIKALQAAAKWLTLSTHVFTETRVKLSECWDKLREVEKERKKEFVEKKQLFKQNFDAVLEKIKVFAEECRQELSREKSHRGYEEILSYMRTVELGRDDVHALKDELHRARQVIVDKERAQEEERVQAERAEQVARRAHIDDLKKKLQELSLKIEDEEAERTLETRDALWEEFTRLSVGKTERQAFDRLFRQIKDGVNRKRERILIARSHEDEQSLEPLEALLADLKGRRQEIKDHLEELRKALGTSGFDFEKAISYREMIESEKESLASINHSIQEIEDKIDSF